MTETKSTEDVLRERKKTHGEYSEHARATQGVIAVWAQERNWADLPPIVRETLHMIAHKCGRIVTGNPFLADHYVDIQGYAKLVEQRIVDGVGLRPEHDLPLGLLDITDEEFRVVMDMRAGKSHRLSGLQDELIEDVRKLRSGDYRLVLKSDPAAGVVELSPAQETMRQDMLRELSPIRAPFEIAVTQAPEVALRFGEFRVGDPVYMIGRTEIGRIVAMKQDGVGLDVEYQVKYLDRSREFQETTVWKTAQDLTHERGARLVAPSVDPLNDPSPKGHRRVPRHEEPTKPGTPEDGGHHAAAESRTCDACGGSGRIGGIDVATGKMYDGPCEVCYGTGGVSH